MSVYLWKWFEEGGTDPKAEVVPVPPPDPPPKPRSTAPPKGSELNELATLRAKRIKRRGSPQAEAEDKAKQHKWRPMRGRK